MDEASAAQAPGDQSYFLTGWRIYRKVLDLNYMLHREVYDTLREAIRQPRRASPFSTSPAATRPGRRVRSRAAASEATPASTSRARRSTSRRASSPASVALSA